MSEANVRTRSKLQTLKRMLTFLRPMKRTAAIAGSVLVLKIVIEVVAVYFLSPVVTTISSQVTSDGQAGAEAASGFWSWISSDLSSASDLRNVIFWMAASQAALSLMIYLRSVWDTKLSQGVVSSMRATVYDHLQHLEFSFYDKMTSGRVMSRALGDLDTVGGFVNMSLLATLDILVSISAYLGLLFWRSPWLVVTALIPVPVWCYVIFRFSKRAAPLYHRSREASDGLMSVITENASGRHVVRAFGSARYEGRKFSAANDNVLSKLLAVVRWQATLNPAMQSLAILSHIAMFFAASVLIQRGVLPIGDLLILGAAIGTILGKLNYVNGIAESFQRAVVSSHRLFEVLDTPAPLLTTDSRASRLLDPRGPIRFEDVVFSYDVLGDVSGNVLGDAQDSSRKPALDGLSCEIPGGCVTAVVGPTGSGKSTLAALLARFYVPASGRVRIGSQDVSELDLWDLRHHVGFVFQETFLFSDTIRNNIRYGRPDVSDEMLFSAARAAEAHEFIEKLADGYDTRIGEGGVQLSGGQRQRLALARALVYDPEILVLDDAMAALDASTESRVRDRLKQLRSGRTVLMITHRPSALHLADHVLVMEEGRVVQSGHPSEVGAIHLMSETGRGVEGAI